MIQFEYLNFEKYFENIREYKNIICFGAGAKLRQAFKLLKNLGIKPTVICDNNSTLFGKKIIYEGETFEITSYDKVKKSVKDYIVLLTMAINNAAEVYQLLHQQGEQNDIVQFCNPFKVDTILIQSKDIDNNLSDFKKIYDNLADDASRRLFMLNLNYKITGNMLDLYKMTEGNTFFDESIIGHHANAVYVDIGAYTGDTILKYLEYCGGEYKHIYAFEADKGNYGEKKEEYGQDEILVETLDNLLLECNPTIIKINALAADFQILKGSKKTIEKYKPIIIMEHGVKPENILEVMFFLSTLRNDYSFFLRQKDIFGDSKTIMYAI